MLSGDKKRRSKSACAANGGPDQDLLLIQCRNLEEARKDVEGVRSAGKASFYVGTFMIRKPGSTRMINRCTTHTFDNKGAYRHSNIFMNYHHIVPLHKMDLTTAERLVQNLAVAETVSGILLSFFAC